MPAPSDVSPKAQFNRFKTRSADGEVAAFILENNGRLEILAPAKAKLLNPQKLKTQLKSKGVAGFFYKGTNGPVFNIVAGKMGGHAGQPWVKYILRAALQISSFEVQDDPQADLDPIGTPTSGTQPNPRAPLDGLDGLDGLDALQGLDLLDEDDEDHEDTVSTSGLDGLDLLPPPSDSASVPPPPSSVPPPPMVGPPPPTPRSATVHTTPSVPETAEPTGPVGDPVGEFTRVAEPYGTGLWKVTEESIYTPSGPTEVPGTAFNVLAPGQDHVNMRIVEAKLEAGLPATPVVPVARSPSGELNLTDKHHTFVAAMALGRPVKLAITRMGLASMGRRRSSWKQCSWKGFEKPGAAARGFGLSSEDSLAHEGEVKSSGDWRSIVPWRANAPTTVAGKVDAVKVGMSGVTVGEHLQGVAEVVPGLADRLYEQLHVDRIQVKARNPPEKTSGGDWDPDTSTIYIDNNLDPLAATDMLVFESLNAFHQKDYRELQHRAHAERMGLADFGTGKATIEAGVTIEYIEFLIQCREAGQPLAPKGQKALAAVDKKVPNYSTMSLQRRQQHRDTLVELIIDTPHGGSETSLPDKYALTTRELYAYEHAATTQNAKGVKGYIRDLADQHDQYAAFRDALDLVPDSPVIKGGGLYYDIVSAAARRVLGLTQVSVFSSHQRTVAEHEYAESGESWAGPLRNALSQLGT